MATLQITGTAGDTRAIATETLDAFAGELDGSLLYPGDEGFGEATLLWNGMITKRPAVAIRAGTIRDVVRTIDFVRTNGLELSVRGGGHNIAGLALSDGGITLDMSGMKDVAVDVDARMVRVGPGCTLGDVDRATQEHGLATTLGFVSETGIAGLTLGGGFERQYFRDPKVFRIGANSARASRCAVCSRQRLKVSKFVQSAKFGFVNRQSSSRLHQTRKTFRLAK